jgi:hypothetical protein
MLGPLFFFNPPLYFALKWSAAARHAACAPLFGTHPRDRAMRFVYPI